MTLSELINVILIRLNYKLIIFSGCADNHNINTTTDNHNINTTVYHSHMCVHVTVVCEVSHIEHAPYNSVLLSKFLLVFLLSFGSCFLRYSADQISGMKPSFTLEEVEIKFLCQVVETFNWPLRSSIDIVHKRRVFYGSIELKHWTFQCSKSVI